MRSYSLYRVVASLDLGDDSVQLIAVEHATVPNLPAGFCIKRRVIEDDLAFFARPEFLHPLPILDEGQHLTIFRAGLQITFED